MNTTELPICKWRESLPLPERHNCYAPYIRRRPERPVLITDKNCRDCKCPDCSPEAGAATFERTTAQMAFSFASAYSRWLAAGKPKPTDEELRLREEACAVCPHRIVDNGVPKCGLCGCGLSGALRVFGMEFTGKLEMATEQCPDNPPRWNALTVV